jgi:hypothetical protein
LVMRVMTSSPFFADAGVLDIVLYEIDKNRKMFLAFYL